MTMFSELPACEGTAHPRGAYGHDGGPARFSVKNSCCDCSPTLQCAGRLKAILAEPRGLVCEECGHFSPNPRDGLTITALAKPDRPLVALPAPSSILNAFALDQRSRGYSDATTIPNRLSTLRSFEQHAGGDLLKLNAAAILAYLGRPGVKASTRRANQATIGAFYRFAQSNKHRKDNPAEKLPPVRVPRNRPRPFSREQIDLLLTSGAYSQTRAMILLGYYQGFRVSSIARVHGNDIDVAGGTIRTIGKGSKDRVLPLHPVIAELAKTMPTADWWFPGRNGAGGSIQPSSVSNLISRAKKRAGITDPKLTAHSLRHSFATHLIEDGADIRIIQELMMHDSLGSTQVYAGVSHKLARAGIERLAGMPLPTRSGRVTRHPGP